MSCVWSRMTEVPAFTRVSRAFRARSSTGRASASRAVLIRIPAVKKSSQARSRVTDRRVGLASPMIPSTSRARS